MNNSVFNADTSTQGIGGLPTYTKNYTTLNYPQIKMFSKSGIYNPSDNVIKFYTNNLDALTIDANQKVICNGSLITNLDYNNISTNKPTLFDGTWTSLSGKPTNFQADWNTTILNKPTLFDGTWTSLSGKPTLFDGTWTSLSGKPTLFDGTWTSLSGKPTNFQADWNTTILNKPTLFDGTWTSLSGKPTNFQADWNTTILNKPTNFQADWNSTIINKPDLTGYSTTTSLNTTSNNLYSYLNTQDTTYSNNNYIFTSNSSNKLINYNNLINAPNLSTYATTTQLAGKENTLTFNSPFTRTTNTIGLSYDSSLSLSATNQLKVANPNVWETGTNAGGGSVLYNILGVGGINPVGTGNIGIGTSVPNYKLDVRGTINSSTGFNLSATSTTNSALTWNNYGVSTIGCAGTAGSYSTSSAVGDMVISADTGKKLILQTGNSTGDFIINGGNIGVGITNPLRKLHLNAPTDVGVYLQMTNSLSGSGAGNGCFFGMDATLLNFVVGNNNNADIYLKTNGSEIMRIKSGGNVGIGNNAPIGTLCVGNSSVVGSDGNIVIGKCSAAGTYRHFKMGLDASYNFCIGDYGGNNTAGTWLNTQFNINYSTGNVGIGVAPSATYKLNVNGSVNATDYYKNGAIYVPANAGGLTGTPNIAVGTITSTTITTNNNAINAGTGGLTCGGISCGGDIVNQYWRLRNDSDWCRLYNNANTGYFNLAVQNFWMGGYIHSWLGVGIQPQCPCHINGSTYFGAVSGYMIYGANSVNANISFSGYYVGLISEGAVWFKTWTLISSDERIKEEIEDINDDTALQMILAIQPKTYKYKDKIEKGDTKVYGFIAQQIKEVIPEAVKLNKEFLPNIYKIADLNTNQITLDFDVSSMMKVNDEISIITDKDGKQIYKITDIINNTFTIDKSLEGDKCLVYGTKVDDFHTLDKNYIFTLNVCATQELHRIIQKQQQEIDELKTSLNLVLDKLNNFISS